MYVHLSYAGVCSYIKFIGCMGTERVTQKARLYCTITCTIASTMHIIAVCNLVTSKPCTHNYFNNFISETPKAPTTYIVIGGFGEGLGGNYAPYFTFCPPLNYKGTEIRILHRNFN